MKNAINPTVIFIQKAINRLIWGFQKGASHLVAFSFIIGFILVNLNLAISQSINFTHPEQISVCQQSTFEISISNTGSSPLENIEIQLNFPCKTEYVVGSINGASDLDVSILDQPKFALADISPGQTITISYRQYFPCDALECINAGDVFSNVLNMSFLGGNLSNIQSPLYNVETPLLVITKIEDPVMQGIKGQTLTRKITIRNSRLGFLTSFTFKDEHGDELKISSLNGNDISTIEETLLLEFNEQHFRQIGDGDDLFEFNEEIIIIETIDIASCSFEETNGQSSLFLEWGCGGELCDISTQSAFIDIVVNHINGPLLQFTPVLNEALCYCSAIPIEQGMKIQNTKQFNDAINVKIDVFQSFEIGSIVGDNVRIVYGDSRTETIPTSFKSPINQDCIPNEIGYREMEFIIPKIQPEETVFIYWDVIFCSKESCIQENNRWSYYFQYTKDCAPPSDRNFTSTGRVEVESDNLLITSTLGGAPTFGDGAVHEIIYDVRSAHLTRENGKLLIEITLPCGMSMFNPDWLFDGTPPSSVDINNQGARTIINLTYDTPLPNVTGELKLPVKYDFMQSCFPSDLPVFTRYITSCPQSEICQLPSLSNHCDPELNGLVISASASLAFDSTCIEICAPKSCVRTRYGYDILFDRICYDSIPGYLDYELNIRRITLGLSDNDDNHRPDIGGVIDLEKIRLDRAIVGDTMNIQTKGIVQIDIPGAEFSRCLISLEIGVNTSFPLGSNYLQDALNQINPNNGFININNDLLIFDKNNNAYYRVTGLTPTNNPIFIDEILLYRFDLSPNTLRTNGVNIPSDFVFKNGDSIIFNSDFVVNYNRVAGSTLNDPFNNIEFTLDSRVVMTNRPGGVINNGFVCGCKRQLFQIAKVFVKLSTGGTTIAPCFGTINNSGSPKNIVLGIPDDFFPFEYKPAAILKTIRYPEIEGLDFLGVNIVFAQANGRRLANIINPTAIQYSSYEPEFIELLSEDVLGFYIFETQDLPDEIIWDDNIEIRFKGDYRNTCQFNGFDGVWSALFKSIEIDFLPYNKNFRETLEIEDRYPIAGSHPYLMLKVSNCSNISLSDSVTWNITLINDRQCPTVSVFTTPSYNTFINVENPSGKLENFKLINVETGNEYPSVNGIFQLDTLFQCDTLNLRLTALNQSCSEESIKINYGWNCEAYTNTFDQIPCELNNLFCSVISPPGVQEIDPDNLELTAPLCNEMPWSEIELFDADLGAIYNMVVEAQFPPGLKLQASTCQIAYPTEDGNYLAIDDPIELSNGVYQWNIHQLLGSVLDRGLPGVSFIPNNSLSLRFKTITDCDFISGAFINYSTTAEKVCEEPTNSLAKVSKALNIEGVSSPYEANMTVSYGENPGCKDSLAINVQVNYSALTSQNDQIIIQLPVGISYKVGSCSGSLTYCTPNIDGNTLTWDVLQGQSSINLSFGIEGFSSEICKSFVIPVYSTASYNAFCTLINQNCAIKVLTGSQIITVSVERPVFRIEGFSVDSTSSLQNGLDFNVTIFNSGVENNSPIVLKLYHDIDGDNQLSAGDIFIESFSVNTFLNSDSRAILQLNSSIESTADFCDLLIVLEGIDNCSCSNDAYPLQTPILLSKYRTDTICSGQSLVLGIENINSNNYNWNDNEGLACIECSETTFSITNDGFNPVTYSLILNEQAPDGCQIAYEFFITVVPKPAIWSTPETICEGQNAILIASEANNYNWEGEGIEIPNMRIQTVSPLQSTEYYVTITDTYGCIGTDTIEITVSPTPVADAGDDISICNGAKVNLQALESEGVSYFWSPGFPVIDDPTLANPTVLTTEDTDFTLTVSYGNCSATDQLSINFYDGIELQVEYDEKKCFGDTSTIIVSGADNYEWSPWFSGMCNSLSCDTVRVITDSDSEFTIVAINNEGCRDTLIINIELIEDQVFRKNEIKTCEGSSQVIFGIERTTEGTYCDTTLFASGCMDIECIELIYQENIATEVNLSICRGEKIQFNGQELTESGTYCQNLQSVNGCDSSNCLVLQVLDLPKITIIADKTSIEEGEEIRIYIEENYPEYLWESNQVLDCKDCNEIEVTPSFTDYYYIEVVDENSCRSNDSIQVFVSPACAVTEVLIPNAFTPNKNGKNDYFRIVNLRENIQSIHISVFNRWGEKVFSEMGNTGWDGYFEGKLAPEEVYIYVITMGCVNGKQKVFKGDLTIVGTK